jgi:EAL domain-containing protein (putative c-di-GMP-specific phosphodiesterase class I)
VQKLNKAKSKDVEATINRVRDMEAALATALDEVEATSLSNIDALEASQEEVARVRERLSEQEAGADLERLVSEITEARSQLSEASTASATAEVCSCGVGCLC